MSATNNHAVNVDELESPAWLDENFFEKVLKHSENNEDIRINNLELNPATAKNDHYASTMFRAFIDYSSCNELKSKTLVLKILPEYNGSKQDILKETLIFETEIGMYTEVIPKFEAILQSIGDNTKLGPKCIYHSLSPKKIVIFEDLAPLGYLPIRGGSANLEDIKMAYKKLAKFHAIGFKLVSEKPEKFKTFCHDLFSPKTFQEARAFRTGMSVFTEMLGEHEDLVQYKPYFEEISKDNVLEQVAASCEAFWNTTQSDDVYYVLCHGDFHDKNIMRKYNDKTGTLEDIMLLDYQFSYVGPMVNDIIYSTYLMLNIEQRINHLNELLHTYFEHFQKTLQRIGYNGEMPKFLEFQKQTLRQKCLAIFLLTCFLPAWYAFKEPDFDMDEMEKSEEYHRNVYKNEVYLNDVRKMLPIFLEQGYFEQYVK